MKKLFIAALAAGTIFVTGCGGASGDPKATLIAFFEALGKKDLAAAKKLATKESETMLGLMEMGMKAGGDNKEMEKFDKTKMEFGDAKVEGDKATVAVKDKASGESTNFTLKKEGGSWKVAFDKSSMMQMGMEKAKEKGMDASDLKEGMDQLKNVNADSLKKAMSEGMKALDTVQNALEKLKQ